MFIPATSVQSDDKAIRFEDLFDLSDIQRLQDEFAAATGVASIITRPDGTPITAPSRFTRLCQDIVRKTDTGCSNCFKSDAVLGAPHPGGPLVQPCLSGGLWDAGASITVGGQHIANWLIGQVRNDHQTEEAMLDYARQIGADEEDFLAAFREVPSMSLEQFERVAQALFTLAKNISEAAYQNVRQTRLIAELNRAQLALRESESRLRALGDNIPGGALYQLVSPPGGKNRYTYVSAGIEKIFGISAQRVLADPASFWQLIVEEDRPLIEAEQQRSAQDLSPFDCEFRQKTPGGELRWLHACSTPRRLSNGSTLWDGVLTDITARKRAEGDRERLTAAIEQSGETILITDTEGAIQYVNPVFVESTGYSLEEVIGQTPSILKSGLQSEAFYRELWQTISSGQIWKGRFTNRRKDGKLYTEDVTISPVRDKAGKIVNYVAAKRDITEHLQLASQLQQAQKMDSIGRLAGGVAHDFNNMLSVILGCSEMALTGLAASHPLFADLQEIRKAAKHSADLTGQLLAFARKQTVAPKLLNLNDTLAEMLTMLRRLISENIELVWVPSPSSVTVKMDPSQLDQILTNLAVNARDAIAASGKLTIETGTADFDAAYCAEHAEAAPGHYAVLTVSDNGCGMDKPTIEHIFEPFFSTKGLGKGTGLGLATVYGIVKQNRGFINVYSEPGEGSTFKICLPRVLAPSELLPLSDGSTEATGQGEVTVLLVEDEPSILRMCERMLIGLGHRVLAARSPALAIALADKHADPIHVLVTDVVMPGMNGRELAERIRWSRPELKCLYMSGYTANVIAHHGVLNEQIHFIQKPFSRQDLAAKIQSVLDDRG